MNYSLRRVRHASKCKKILCVGKGQSSGDLETWVPHPCAVCKGAVFWVVGYFDISLAFFGRKQNMIGVVSATWNINKQDQNWNWSPKIRRIIGGPAAKASQNEM